jgi:hypothetical protein
VTLPHLAEDEVAVDFLWRVETCSLGCLVVVEGYFDPVAASFVDAAFPEGISGEVFVDNHGV